MSIIINIKKRKASIGKHKNLLLLLPTSNAQTLSAIIQTISIDWYILNKFGETKSGLYLALYFACCLTPQILVGPLLGILVDKYNRKKYLFLPFILAFFLSLTVAVSNLWN